MQIKRFFFLKIARYLSVGFRNLKVSPARRPPASSATMWIHMSWKLRIFITAAPMATAGLNAPPEIAPTANIPCYYRETDGQAVKIVVQYLLRSRNSHRRMRAQK